MNSLTFSIFDKISVESLNENKGYISLELDTDKKKDIEKRLDLFNLEDKLSNLSNELYLYKNFI